MNTTTRLSRRLVTSAAGVLAITALTMGPSAVPAAAAPETPVPVCAGAKELLVDVTHDVENSHFILGRDGRMWASFDYSERVRIWKVGGRQHCVRLDAEGTFETIAGTSPGLTGTVSDGVTGTFADTEWFMWTGRFDANAPSSGHLGSVDAGCTPDEGCQDDSHFLVSGLYFAQGTNHCTGVRGSLEMDAGAHGHISIALDGPRKLTGTGDITG